MLKQFKLILHKVSSTSSTKIKPYIFLTLMILEMSISQQAVAQNSVESIPAELRAAASTDADWQPPRFSWGDPNLEGTFTSRDMSGIPMERPSQFGTRENLTIEEFQQRVASGPGGLAVLRAGAEFEGEARLQLSALDSSEVGTRTFGYTSYIIEPANGQIPAFTAEGEQRQISFSRGQSNGPFFTAEDFSYYDRCISRGITGSILPSLYGDAMHIVQSPTEVSITYEMLHDTRVIPLTNSSLPDSGLKQYMGSSIGYFEGDTLVVETRNLTDKLSFGRMAHSEEAVITERFTRIDPEMINYAATINDQSTFLQPWTFRLTLTTQPNYEVLEYSCHEGNFFVANALRSEQRYQTSVTEARARDEVIPERNSSDGSLQIYQAPSSIDAININAGE